MNFLFSFTGSERKVQIFITMYGLLLENLAEYVKINYGEEKWEDIRRQAGIDSPSFSVHQVYPENLLQKLAKKAQQVLSSIIHRRSPFHIHSSFSVTNYSFLT